MKYTVIYHASPADAANGLKSSKEFLDFDAAVDFYHGCVSARMGAVQLIHPEPSKLFNTQTNVGTVKYLVNFHDGVKHHKDGSPFFDIRTFTNKVTMNQFIKTLKTEGYTEVSQPKSDQGDTTEAQTCDQGDQIEAPMLVLIKRAKGKMTSIQLLPQDQALAIWDQLLKEDQMYVVTECKEYLSAEPENPDINKHHQLMTPDHLQKALDSFLIKR